ncbi:MAG: lipoyl synthase [Candidatus Sumerlaeaceae bacterium]|nr:lipoyl synthase [Candidatus Sumerlaeaceae bacterium]
MTNTRAHNEIIHSRHPAWIRARMPGLADFAYTQQILRNSQLHTVCEEAQCPNRSECYAHKTATFMILGNVCTRRCAFCAVPQAIPASLPDPDEPERLADAVEQLGLRHVVITSVDRDDLPDQGAAHYVRCVEAILRRRPGTRVELLIPDFRGDEKALRTILSAPIAVLGHNIETVPRLYPVARRGARYDRSLLLLARAKEIRPEVLTKSGVMLGLGEHDFEVEVVLSDLRDASVDIVTLGQYLQPTPNQLPVRRYLTPAEFEHWRQRALAFGFGWVEAGPLVRSSYHAWQQVEGLSQSGRHKLRAGNDDPETP